MKKILNCIAGVLTFFLLATSAQASTTFDLNLSVLGTGAADLDNIYSLIFDGTPQLNLTPDTATSGTFSETGTGFINLYRTAPGANGQNLPVSGLTFSFTGLTGTYTVDSMNITSISFDPDQIIDLQYNGTTYARFLMDPSSGGHVQQIAGGVITTLNQYYYFQLIENNYGLLEGPDHFEAVLTASAFNGGNYVMVGEANAVPVPGSLVLIFSGLACLAGFRRNS